MARTVPLKSGQMLFLRLTVSTPQEATLRVECHPDDTHHPLGTTQEFAVHPLPTPVVAVLPAATSGDYHVTISCDGPFTEKFSYAQTLAQEQWYQVDLTRQVNRGFADPVAGDGLGGWTDEGPEDDLHYMPTGLLTLYGVPFRVIDPADNRGRSCVVLRAGPGPGTRTNRAEYPRSVTIPVGRRTNVFYFLVGIGWGDPGPAATLTVHYADGQTASVLLSGGMNVLNWWNPPLPNADDHKFVPARKDRFLYAVQWRWPNSDPDSAICHRPRDTVGAART